MFFKKIPGNNKTKKELILGVKTNRISHAQLFSGNSGGGKLALAFAYARYLNCINKLDEDSCGECSSCFKYNTLTHTDLHLIFPVLKIRGAKTAISDHFINNWRSFVLKNVYGSLNDWIDTFGAENKTGESGSIYKDEAISLNKKLSLKNFEGAYRIVLIWMPEQMDIKTSNKLLKILEEPPSRTIFLVVSEKPDTLLPTIVSRLQKTHVQDFTIDDIAGFFKNENVSLEKIKQLKSTVGPDLGKISLLLKEEGAQETDLLYNFSSWMRFAYKIDIVNVSKWVDSISEKGRKYQKIFLSYCIKMIRECIIFNYANNLLLKTDEKELVFITKFAPFIHEQNSVLIIEELERAIHSSKRNANSKILFFVLSLQMIKYLKVKRKFAIN